MAATDAIDWKHLSEFSERMWEDSALPSLCEFIEIPALSPAFDSNWSENGYLDATIDLFIGWLETVQIKGLSVSVHSLEGRTPILLLDVEGSIPGEVCSILILINNQNLRAGLKVKARGNLCVKIRGYLAEVLSMMAMGDIVESSH